MFGACGGTSWLDWEINGKLDDKEFGTGFNFSGSSRII